jgi:uncharacterized protein YndB with AHSA1/START domain
MVGALSACAGGASAAGDAGTPSTGRADTAPTAPAAPAAPTKKDLVVTRVLDAPVEQVWQAWTQPEHVKRWWGPAGFTSPIAELDVRVGGTSLVAMRSPQGQDMYNTWEYRVVEPMARLEFVMNFADRGGRRIDPASIGLPPGVPQDVHHVITFEALDERRTQLTVTERGYTSDQVMEISRTGLEQSLDKMAASFTQA